MKKTCSEAKKAIKAYYFREFGNDDAEIEGIKDACDHIYDKNSSPEKIVCEDCWGYLKDMQKRKAQ